MKKVLVLAAAAALFATPALASIATTAHDLSSSAPTQEICVWCHTPHGGITGGIAPLWNRDTTNATNVYTSNTLNATLDAASVNATDAPLCLSCHDGAVGNALVNQPNGGSVNDPGAFTLPNTNLFDGANNLSNDHPVGFTYDAALVAADGELKDVATVQGVLGSDVFYGGTMWCSSCHDVHDDTTGSPFLRVSNANSDLCLACHNK
jgi:predicted CXXCH cytochrome family protein